MSYTSILNGVVQQGRGTVAGILGSPYNVYRLAAGMYGSITAGAPVATIFAKLEKATKATIEANTFELEVFNAKCDNRTLQFGDILVGTGDDPATYAYAQYRDFQPTLFVRLENMASLAEPYNAASSASTSSSDTVFVANYGGIVEGVGYPITLSNGIYGRGGITDTPAQIPVGICMLNRVKDLAKPELPDAMDLATYILYVPPLGYELVANTLVTLNNGDQYVILNARESLVGFRGTICTARKAQAGST